MLTPGEAILERGETMTRQDHTVNSVMELVRAELARAREQHPQPFHSAHEGYAVLLEEVDELWEEIVRKDRVDARVREEVIQVAAMAVRFCLDVCQKQEVR